MAKVTIANNGKRKIALRFTDADKAGKPIVLPEIVCNGKKRTDTEAAAPVLIEESELAKYLQNPVNKGFFDSGELSIKK